MCSRIVACKEGDKDRKVVDVGHTGKEWTSEIVIAIRTKSEQNKKQYEEFVKDLMSI